MKKSFSLKIQSQALEDIQEGIKYYNSQQKVLGNKFFNEVDKSLKQLKKNPFFQIRYDNVRCLPVKKFPYMFHYTILEDSKVVIVYAVINTYQNPSKNWVKLPKK